MRALLLAMAFSMTASAVSVSDPYAPSNTKEQSPECQALLLDLRATAPSADVEAQLLREKRGLDLKIDEQVLRHGSISRETELKGLIAYENVLLALARGDGNEILKIVRPVSYIMIDSYRTLSGLAKQIAELKKREALSHEELEKLAYLEEAFKIESVTYGENYGSYIAAMELLESVANGKGVANPYGAITLFQPPGAAPAPPAPGEVEKAVEAARESELPSAMVESVVDHHEPTAPAAAAVSGNPNIVITINGTTADTGDGAVGDGKKPEPTTPALPIAVQQVNSVVYALTTARAINAATQVLKLLNPQLEARWFLNSPPATPPPSLNEMSTMFNRNIYAMLAKLRRDWREQQKTEKGFRKVVNLLSDFYLNMTSYDYIPERYRRVLLKFAGIQYDRLMLERYLGKILKVVQVSRVRNDAGNLILMTTDEMLDLQYQTLREFSSNATGDDMLITFARLSFHSSTWSNIKNHVAKKTTLNNRVQGTLSTTNIDKIFLDRMTAAEVRAGVLKGIPLIYQPQIGPYMWLLGMQLTYAFATEQAVQNFLAPHVPNVVHLFPFLN